MWKKFRVQVFIGFMSIVALAIIAFAINGYVVTEWNSLSKTSETLTQLKSNFIEANAEFDHLVYVDNKDTSFHKTGESPSFLRLKDELAEAEIHLNHLLSDPTMDQEKYRSTLDSISAQLTSMESKSNEMLELMLSRGFWYYGTEGSMRRYAIALDQQGVVPTEELLIMRKYEKDYQLRYDQKYFDLLEEKAYQLIEENNFHDSVDVLLMSYQHAFERMVELDQDLGLGRTTGITSELQDSFLIIHHDSESLLKEYNQERESLYSELVYLWFLAIGGILGLSIFMSTYLSGKLSADIKGLTKRLHNYVANGFKDPAKKELSQNTVQEVSDLEENFNVMKRELEKLLADLREERRLAEEAAA
ncbi:MAG: hypothetical protein AAF193_05900, partial [Bacteroidota bacterium]